MLLLVLMDCWIGFTTLVGMFEYNGIGYGAVGRVILAVCVGVMVIEELLIDSEPGMDGTDGELLVAIDMVICDGFFLLSISGSIDFGC